MIVPVIWTFGIQGEMIGKGRIEPLNKIAVPSVSFLNALLNILTL